MMCAPPTPFLSKPPLGAERAPFPFLPSFPCLSGGVGDCISLPEGYSPNSTKVQRLLRNVYELAGDKDEL